MDIGTAKLTRGRARGVPHHLLDVWDVTRPGQRGRLPAAGPRRHRRRARPAAGCRSSSAGPGCTSGPSSTTSNFPGTDPEVRERLEAELAARGPAALHARLAALDPDAAARDPAGQRAPDRPGARGDRAVRAAVHRDAAQLRVAVPRGPDRAAGAAAARRADRAAGGADVAAGLVAEVRGLTPPGCARAGRRAGRSATRRCSGSWPGSGPQERPRDETVRATRRFARRQESWFRRDPRVSWLDAGPGADRGRRWLPSSRGGRPASYGRQFSEHELRGARFAKGHGTENDFVILPDPRRRTRSHRRARRAAVRPAGRDRRRRGAAGGADRRRRPARPDAGRRRAEWFMDYRNADGSIAEMCGNGIRVFARYLLETGLAAGEEFTIATRGGPRLVRVRPDGGISADMGAARVLGPGHGPGRPCLPWPADFGRQSASGLHSGNTAGRIRPFQPAGTRTG